MMVENNSCPRDIVLYSRQRVTSVYWPPISFSGQANVVNETRTSGLNFLL